MRSNRPNYASTPAGSAKALDQKPKPKRSKREINQLMLTLFFIVLPVLGLLAIFFQPMRWAFMIAVVAAVAVMWVIHAFLFPGRMILTAVYGLLMVFTLVNALSASHASSGAEDACADACAGRNRCAVRVVQHDGHIRAGRLL